jgi:hypothetical protein
MYFDTPILALPSIFIAIAWENDLASFMHQWMQDTYIKVYISTVL